MFEILTLNKISATGLAHFPDGFHCSDATTDPDAVIVRSASMLETEFAPNLLAIARAGAGYNNIPVDRCTENGICVFNTPGANSNAVKELVICALFLASRKIVKGAQWCETLKGNENVSKAVEKGKGNFVGPEILGKTLGVIGLGAIGIKVANAAKALGMNVIGYDPFITGKTKEALNSGIALTADTDDIFAAADYITLHAPLNDATRGIICEENLAKCKDGVRVLNFARGELVDNASIIAALANGKCAAYATDFPTDDQLGTDGVIAIPHLGASTPEAEENCAVMAVEQIADYLLNGNVKNSVNLPALAAERNGKVRLTAITKGDVSEKLNVLLSEAGIVINNAVSAERKGIGYFIADTDSEITDETIEEVRQSHDVLAFRII